MAVTLMKLYGLVNVSISVEFYREQQNNTDFSHTEIDDPLTGSYFFTFGNKDVSYTGVTVYGPDRQSIEGYFFSVTTFSFGGYWLEEANSVSTLPPPPILQATYTADGRTHVKAWEAYRVVSERYVLVDLEKDGDRYPLNTLFTEIVPPDPEEQITVSIAPPADRIVEPDNTNTTATFVVSLNKPSASETITVDYSMRSGTALGGVDFGLSAGTLTFLPGETSKSITVTIKGDLDPELEEETFHIDLSNPRSTGSTTAVLNGAHKTATGVIHEHPDPGKMGEEVGLFTTLISSRQIVVEHLLKMGKEVDKTQLDKALGVLGRGALLAGTALDVGAIQNDYQKRMAAASTITDHGTRAYEQWQVRKKLTADVADLACSGLFAVLVGTASVAGTEAAITTFLAVVGISVSAPVIVAAGAAILGGLAAKVVYDKYFSPLVRAQADAVFDSVAPLQKPVPIYIEGRSSNDVIYGGDSDDALYGGGGKDKINGHAGNDDISGGAANDTLTGGKGKDAFVFDAKLGTSKTDRKVNFDKITDFSVKDDSLYLDNAIFKKLGKGSDANPKMLKKDYLKTGSKAEDRNDYILYNKKTGVLSYDVDGSGPKAAVEFAQVKKGLALTHKDFFIV